MSARGFPLVLATSISIAESQIMALTDRDWDAALQQFETRQVQYQNMQVQIKDLENKMAAWSNNMTVMLDSMAAMLREEIRAELSQQALQSKLLNAKIEKCENISIANAKEIANIKSQNEKSNAAPKQGRSGELEKSFQLYDLIVSRRKQAMLSS